MSGKKKYFNKTIFYFNSLRVNSGLFRRLLSDCHCGCFARLCPAHCLPNQ